MFNNLQVITFDFWNTLFTLDSDALEKRREARINRLYEFIRDIGQIRTLDQVRDGYLKMTRRWENSWLKGLPASTPRERIVEIFSYLDCQVNPTKFNVLVENLEKIILTEGTPVPMNGAFDTLRALSGKYPLGIISDTGMTPGRIVRVLLERHEMLGYFSCFSFSDEVGFYKPDSRIFHHALSCLQVSPDKACHVGDFIHTDIRGAKELGMGAILLGNNEQINSQHIAPDLHVSSHHELLRFFTTA